MSSRRLPVVLVQTSGLEVGHGELLAERLGGRRVHTLASPRMTEATMLTRVAAWVDHHHRSLDEQGIEAPFTLVGWSFGGVVAMELARRLRSEGAHPAFVGLLDTIRPRIRPVRLRDAVPHHLTEAALLSDPGERRDYLAREAKMRVGRRVRRYRAAVVLRVAAARGRTSDYVAKPVDPNVRAIHRSYLHHVAAPIDFPVTLYTVKGSVGRCNGDPSLRWSPFLRSGFSTVPISGGHYSMWDPPHLDALASRLAVDLAAVDDAFGRPAVP